MRWIVLLLGLTAFSFGGMAASGAQAAEITRRAMPSGSWIMIRGDLRTGDDGRFHDLLARTPDAQAVVLESNGGKLLPGIEIGTAIRARQLSTVVGDFARCASSCALAWLGGTRRFMGTGARIGFHAAFVHEADQGKQTSGVGNALVGAYLSRLGLSDRAVTYITVADPNQILWLTMEAARALDIEVSPTASAAAIASQPVPTIGSRGAAGGVVAGNLEQIARDFPFTFFDQAGQAPGVAMAYFEGVYAEEVAFNNTQQPRARVLAARQRLMEHWPEQAYRIRPDTVLAQCNRMAGLCEVAGVMDWEWSSWGRGARASGSSRFWFRLSMETGAPVIRAEGASVISRQTSGPQ